MTISAADLQRVVPAPPQQGSDRILSVELYETGLAVRYIGRRREEPTTAEEATLRGMSGLGPAVMVQDDVETDYRLSADGWGSGDAETIHGVQVYTPAVPADARTLSITTDSGLVPIELGS